MLVVLTGLCLSSLEAGFRSPESLVRNVYAYYGDRSSDLSNGLPRETRICLLVMAAGLIVGTFVGSLLLGVVPNTVLLPLLAAILVISAVCGGIGETNQRAKTALNLFD